MVNIIAQNKSTEQVARESSRSGGCIVCQRKCRNGTIGTAREAQASKRATQLEAHCNDWLHRRFFIVVFMVKSTTITEMKNINRLGILQFKKVAQRSQRVFVCSCEELQSVTRGTKTRDHHNHIILQNAKKRSVFTPIKTHPLLNVAPYRREASLRIPDPRVLLTTFLFCLFHHSPLTTQSLLYDAVRRRSKGRSHPSRLAELRGNLLQRRFPTRMVRSYNLEGSVTVLLIWEIFAELGTFRLL